MQFHPDRFHLNRERHKMNKSEATRYFQEIQHAYETLSDPHKRKRYDSTLPAPSSAPAPAAPSTSMPAPASSAYAPVDGHSMATFLASMMQQSPAFSASFARNMEKPLPIVKTITISLEKSFTGGVVPLEIDRYCIHNGEKVREKETVYITLPKGVDDGEMVLVENKGNMVSPSCMGDVKVFVRLESNATFHREGLDLHFEKWISIREALCGFEFQCVLPTKKKCHFVSPAGTVVSDNEKKIVEGAGFLRDGCETAGNAIITFRVQFPHSLTAETVNELNKIKWV